MPNWVNFAEIRTRVSLEDVIVRFYGITTLKRDGPKIVGPCPVHNGDSPRAFHADLDRNVWHCFSKCRRGGNQLDFVAVKESISIRDAALKLQTFFLHTPGSAGTPRPGATTSASSAPAPTASPPPPAAARAPAGRSPIHPPTAGTAAPSTTSSPTTVPTPPASPPTGGEEKDGEGNPILNLKLDLKNDHPHLLQDRRLQVATCEHFGIGYCSRGILKGMIAIPIHDEEGDLVAYAGRRLKPADVREFGKYKFPKGFRKELVLYNLHRARPHLAEHGLILVEGFFTVLKLAEAGFPNVAAVMGCELSDHQARLAEYAKEVILLFDGGEAGWRGATAAREKLTARVPVVRLIRLPPDTEPESFEPKAIRWMINGVRALDLAEVAFTPRPASPTPTSRGGGP